eukprot:1000096-Amphidinium_carterae.1
MGSDTTPTCMNFVYWTVVLSPAFGLAPSLKASQGKQAFPKTAWSAMRTQSPRECGIQPLLRSVGGVLGYREEEITAV